MEFLCLGFGISFFKKIFFFFFFFVNDFPLVCGLWFVNFWFLTRFSCLLSLAISRLPNRTFAAYVFDLSSFFETPCLYRVHKNCNFHQNQNQNQKQKQKQNQKQNTKNQNNKTRNTNSHTDNSKT